MLAGTTVLVSNADEYKEARNIRLRRPPFGFEFEFMPLL
jgi:hypothetical protein